MMVRVAFIMGLALLVGYCTGAQAAVTAATCFVTAGNGERFYKHNGKTKTLGTVSAIKPCPVQPLIIVYDNPKGMRLYVNPPPEGPERCLYLTVIKGSLSAYDATTRNANGDWECE